MYIRNFFIFSIIFSLLFGSVVVSYAQTSEEDRTRLYSELKILEDEIAQKEAQLNEQRKHSGTIKKDVDILTSQINTAKLKIKQKNLLIDKFSKEITSKTKTIGVLEDKLDVSKDSLTQLLKKTNDLSQENVIYMLLSNKSVSGFYQDLDSFASIKRSVKSAVDTIKVVKADTEEQKKDLQDDKDGEIDAKVALEGQKKQVEKNQTEKGKLLALSKQKESAYQKELADRAKKVADIKSRLFRFAGGQTKAIPFETALIYAEKAEGFTGAPASLVLAILTQESALGANVGRCYLTNEDTGEGYNLNTKEVFKNVMKPTRDVKPFIEITAYLGMDYKKTVISCPIKGVAGWGGAMGPAQFIPSTWKVVQDKVRNITGSSNPWNAQDSITASSVYLASIGASSSYTSQIRAACRYYGSGGATCSYGRQVMSRLNRIQDDIDYLKQYGVSRR